MTNKGEWEDLARVRKTIWMYIYEGKWKLQTPLTSSPEWRLAFVSRNPKIWLWSTFQFEAGNKRGGRQTEQRRGIFSASIELMHFWFPFCSPPFLSPTHVSHQSTKSFVPRVCSHSRSRSPRLKIPHTTPQDSHTNQLLDATALPCLLND